MKLIVGLGNPGEKYVKNRHNVGFQFLDYLVQKLEVPSTENTFKTDKRLGAEILKINMDEEVIILDKPQTFMNESGKAVRKIVTSYKLQVTRDLVVVHDDLDIKIGAYKLQLGKGPKIHGGVLSIENELRDTNFWRLRIGVDNRDAENRIPGEAYVLQNFTGDEQKILKSVFDSINLSLLLNPVGK